MTQKKVERNVFVHYNVRLRLKNMKKARNQGEQEGYCPINLDYIFAEDDPLLPWLENREKEIEAVNSEEENMTQLITTSGLSMGTTTRSQPTPIIEVEEGFDSSATESDDNDDSGSDGNEDNTCAPSAGLGERSESVVPSTYPYPYASSSQSQHTSGDRGKSPLIQEEGDEDEVEADMEAPTIECMYQTPPAPQPYDYGYGPYGYPHDSFYNDPPPHYNYGYMGTTFSYPPQPQQYGYGQANDDDDDNAPEPARHSFWW